MPEAAPPIPVCQCMFAGTARQRMVDEMLAIGMSCKKIEAATRQKGVTVKEETAAKHLRVCLGGERPSGVVAKHTLAPATTKHISATKESLAVPPEHPTRVERDLARLVQQKAVEGLESGALTVTVKDGLAATSLIDKREARLEERRFMLGLARLLSGAGAAGPRGDDPDVIDVTPRNPLLAPESLRADD